MRFLLVKLNHIGDTLLLTPTLHWLREAYPNAIIDVVVRKGCEAILEHNPDISNVYAVARPETARRTYKDSLHNLKIFSKIFFSRSYDFAFDLSNSDRAKILVLAAKSKHRCINVWHTSLGGWSFLFNSRSEFAWGVEHQVLKDFKTVQDCVGGIGEAGPLVLNSNSSLGEVASLLEKFDPSKPYVVFHPASRWAFKEWSVEKWVEVVNWFSQQKLQVVITGGSDEREQGVAKEVIDKSEAIDSTGLLHLLDVATLLSHAKLYIGIDTAVMHMAAAMRTPCVVIFGPSSEWSWAPWECRQELVLAPCSCKQTRSFICDKTTTYPCMVAVEPSQVIFSIEKILR